jgi:folylpolyglutamate synthase/dihydropteroate synthase
LKGNQRLIDHFHNKIRIAMEHSNCPVRMRLTSRTLTLILDVGNNPHANHHPLARPA